MHAFTHGDVMIMKPMIFIVWIHKLVPEKQKNHNLQIVKEVPSVVSLLFLSSSYW